MCCTGTCYPREEEDIVRHIEDVSNHPYLAPVSSESTPYTPWQGSETQQTV